MSVQRKDLTLKTLPRRFNHSSLYSSRGLHTSRDGRAEVPSIGRISTSLIINSFCFKKKNNTLLIVAFQKWRSLSQEQVQMSHLNPSYLPPPTSPLHIQTGHHHWLPWITPLLDQSQPCSRLSQELACSGGSRPGPSQLISCMFQHSLFTLGASLSIKTYSALPAAFPAL